MADSDSLFTTAMPSGMSPDVEFHYSDRVIEFVKALHPIMPILIYSREDIFVSYCTNQYILKQGYSVAEYRGLLDLFYVARGRLSCRQAGTESRLAGSGNPSSTSIGTAWGFITNSISDALDMIVKKREATPVEVKTKPIVQSIVKKPLAATNYETALAIIVDQYLYEIKARQAKSAELVSSVKAPPAATVTVTLDDPDVENGSGRNPAKPVSPFKKQIKNALAYNEMHNVWLGESMLLFDYEAPEDANALNAMWMERYTRRTSLARRLLSIEKKRKVSGHVAYIKQLDRSVPVRPNEQYVGQNIAAWYCIAKQQIDGKLLIQGRSSSDGDNTQPTVDPTWQWYYDQATGSLMCPRLVFQQIMQIMHEFRLYGIQEQIDSCVLEMEVLRMKHWVEHGRVEDELRQGEIPSRFVHIENSDPRYKALSKQYEVLVDAKTSGADRVTQLCEIINEEVQHGANSRRRALCVISEYTRSIAAGSDTALSVKVKNDEQVFVLANGIDEEGGGGGDEEESDSDNEEEADGNNKQAESTPSPPTHHLKPATVRLVELITDKTISSFDYLAISKALNFLASHEWLCTEQEAKILQQFPDTFVEIKLKEMTANASRGDCIGEVEFAENREAAYHARYFPYLFYTLVRYFAMPYFDISLVSSDMGSATLAPTTTNTTPVHSSTAAATSRGSGSLPGFLQPQPYTQFPIQGVDPLPDIKAPGIPPKTATVASHSVDDRLVLQQVLSDYKESSKAKPTTVFDNIGNLLIYPVRYADENAKVVFDALVFPPQGGSKPGPSLAKARKDDHATAVWRIYPH